MCVSAKHSAAKDQNHACWRGTFCLASRPTVASSVSPRASTLIDSAHFAASTRLTFPLYFAGACPMRLAWYIKPYLGVCSSTAMPQEAPDCSYLSGQPEHIPHSSMQMEPLMWPLCQRDNATRVPCLQACKDCQRSRFATSAHLVLGLQSSEQGLLGPKDLHCAGGCFRQVDQGACMRDKACAHELPDQHCQVGRDGHHPALQILVQLTPVLRQRNHLSMERVSSVFPKLLWRYTGVHLTGNRAEPR